MRCVNCRLIIPESEAYCPFCQHRVETPTPEGQPEPETSAEPDPERVTIPASGPEPPEVAPPPADGEAEGVFQSSTPPPPAEPEVPAAGRKPAASGRPALTYALVAALAFGALKLGVFDNFLLILGLKPPPAPAAPVSAPAEPALPQPAPEEAPVEAIPEPQAPDRWQQAYQALERPAKAPEPGTPLEPEAPPVWTFEGLLYDMLTLRPIPGVDVIFVGDSKTYSTRSDARGRYRIEVPSVEGPGYTVVIEHRHYIEDYFPETSPPYRSLAPARRGQLRSAIPKAARWKGRRGEVLRRDAVLFPLIPDR